MKELTSYERFKRMYGHREADRVPIIDDPWPATIERWQREGLPEGAPWEEFFGLDRPGHINADNSPRFPKQVIEETEEYKITTTEWGVTMKNWKHSESTPGFLDFRIHDRASWEIAKARMTPARDRIDWKYLAASYPAWRESGRWIFGHFWFGFDPVHAWAVGTERVLMAMVEDPEWVVDMINTYLDLHIALFDMIWDAGYHFDAVIWYDDMGYKQHQFFSVKTYREMIKPAHKRGIEWAHAHGIPAHLHSCGDIRPLIPELLDIGLDALNPLEVKAGMDTLQIKKAYGDKLLLHGGINAMLWDNTEAIEAEIQTKLPTLKENGGYIFSSDHSVPSSVSLKDFQHIVELAKKLGAY